MCLDVILLGFVLPGTHCFLDLVDYALSHVMEVFSHYFFSGPFSLSSLSGTPMVHLLKVSKGVDLKNSQHRKENATMCGDFNAVSTL